jgi:hypothetical protein
MSVKKSREHVVAPNHLKQVKMLLEKSLNLLNEGIDIHPYQGWRDSLNSIVDEIQEVIEEQ